MFVKTQVMTISEFMRRKEVKDLGFFLQQLEKEVKSVQDKRKLEKFQKITMAALISGLTVLAMTNEASAKIINNGSLPPEIDALLLKLQLICLGLSATLAVLTLMIAGTYRMFGMGSKANSWSTEIIKGLVQVLIAPPLVGIIVSIIRVFTKGLPGFIPF